MSDKETLFSAKNRGLLLGPLSKNNLFWYRYWVYVLLLP